MNLILRLKYKYWYIRDKYRNLRLSYIKNHNPRRYAEYLYRISFGREIDWKNPRDLNEKILYLEFFTDTSEWIKLADKYAVREFVKERGCEEILVPLFGKWDSVEAIDFDTLPEKFVLKTNNGCGDATIVKDKKCMDKIFVTQRLNKAMHTDYGIESAEPHYRKIKPCIIAEQLLEPSNGDLIDYKIWCLHGKPYCILTCSDRNIAEGKVTLNLFDLSWNRKDNCLTYPYRNNTNIPKPTHFEEMLDYANKLSKGLAQVRVDFYEVNGKVYFGEMTMTSAAGRMGYFTQEFLKEMGDKVKI